MHNSFAVSGEGMPLGIFSQYFIERKDLRGHEITGSTSYQKPISSKESFRWIQIIQDFNAVSNLRNVVHIADRETDIYELYREAIAMDEQFLIRARVDRSINKQSKRQPSTVRLFSFFKNHDFQRIYKIAIQTNSDQRYRDIELRISYSSFNLDLPPNKTANKDGKALPNLKAWGIIAREDTPLEGVERICWLLITNLPINIIKEAIEKIKWYFYRWNIELFLRY